MLSSISRFAALQGRQVTVGDLVAHAISLNELSQLLKAFDTLLDDQFTKRISTVDDRYEVEIEGEAPVAIIKDVPSMFQSVSRISGAAHPRT
jgi:hypothetical protein